MLSGSPAAAGVYGAITLSHQPHEATKPRYTHSIFGVGYVFRGSTRRISHVERKFVNPILRYIYSGSASCTWYAKIDWCNFAISFYMPTLGLAIPYKNDSARWTNLDSLDLRVIPHLQRRLPYRAGYSTSIIRARNAATHPLPGRVRIDNV